MNKDIEIMELKVQKMKVDAAAEGFKLKIMQRSEEIKRLEQEIENQYKYSKEIEEKIKQLTEGR